MTGAVNAVHIYYTDARALDEGVTVALVTAEDRLRVSAAMPPRRRAEYLAGRALLRHALERETGRAAASFRIRASQDGKPECIGGPAISLAHSGELVVCAVAERGAVGVDVETRRPRTDPAMLAERYFTAGEARWVEADPDARFRMLWVLKEAYLKALGVGLAGGLAALECRIELPTILVRLAGDGAGPNLELRGGQGCYLGLAVIDAPSPATAVQRFAPAGEPDAFGPFAVIAATA